MAPITKVLLVLVGVEIKLTTCQLINHFSLVTNYRSKLLIIATQIGKWGMIKCSWSILAVGVS